MLTQHALEFDRSRAVLLFGPRRGCLVQAKFNKSGMLKIRDSPIYSFALKDDAPFDLFVRYYACDPRDGTDYGFYSDEEDGVHHGINSALIAIDAKRVAIFLC